MPALTGPGGRHSYCNGDGHSHSEAARAGRRLAAAARGLLVAVAVVWGAAGGPVFAQTPAPLPSPLTPPPPSAEELARAQDLVRANALGLAQEILESRAPALQPSPAWLAWERQLWVVYRLSGRWAELYARAAPALNGAHWPPAIRREARLQAIRALAELKRGAEARRLIDAVLADADAPPVHHRQARRARVASFLADGLAAGARRALRDFQTRYGLSARAADRDLQFMTAAVALQSGDAEAAVSELATVDSAPARLLKLYARLVRRALPAAEVAAQARELLESPGAKTQSRAIHALIAAAHMQAGAQYPLADALEAYLLTPPAGPAVAGVYPQFTVADLRAAYAAIAAHQIARASLPAGDMRAHLDYALGLPAALGVARKALFAQLAATADDAEIRRAAVDGYVGEIVNSGRIALLPLLFGDRESAPLGGLSLDGPQALRLGAAAVAAGDFRLAAAAHAAMREFPPGAPETERRAWLLRAGRVDLLAGHPARGAAKLDAYLESFTVLNAAQTNAVLQPIFDLQTLGEHALALPLLRKVDALAPRGKHMREIAFWLAESHAGVGDPKRAAAAFLRSAMAGEDSFDRWGRAARFRAAEALLDAGLFADARRQLRDLLAGANTDAGRLQLRQTLQRARLLEANSPSPDSPSPPAE